MTTPHSTASAANAERPRPSNALAALLTRLHLYIGLFIGPFLLVAAVSGIAYALTPQLENWRYHDALTTRDAGTAETQAAQPLAAQIAAAQHAAGIHTSPSAVRPATHAGATTRVMFTTADSGPSEHRALFVDPVSLEIRGDLPVYGTSGVLPLRALLDQFHRGLLLGDVGRLYSELAASWLWIGALSGCFLWWHRRQPARAPLTGRRRRHATMGLCAAIGLLLFSATGLTWSQWAGGNIAELRHAWGWSTPSVSTELDATPLPAGSHQGSSGDAADPHAEHRAMTMAAGPRDISPADFDRVLQAARDTGLSAAKIELLPPTAPNRAWKVREIGREWPTQVDEAAIDPTSFAVLERTDFTTFPLAAKLTRWGIDLHMGVLFGLPNQLMLIGFAGALATLIGWGYAMWWQRRRYASAPASDASLARLVQRLPRLTRIVVVLIAASVGYALPVLGVSLLAFAVIDALRVRLARARLVANA